MTAAAPDSVVQLRDVSKRYGETVAVAGVSFDVPKGRVIALLGPSGCGKTTTLRIIAGFVQPDSGEVLIQGRNMRGVRPYERNIGLVFQDYALFPHMSVGQNVAYGLRQRGWARDSIAERIREMLRLVRLDGCDERHPAELSGGQQQRVALARALASGPELLLLDEPLSALDAKLRDELRSELKQILAIAGATTIVVTHDQDEAMSLAEHIVVMVGGRILQQGPPAEVYRAPSCREVALFLGRTNWFDGELGSVIESGCREFRCPEGPFAILDTVIDDGTAHGLCVRPERLLLSPVTESDQRHGNRVDGVVAEVLYLGAEAQISLRLDSGRLLLVTQQDCGQSLPASGQRVAAHFRPEDAVLVPLK